MGDYEPAFLRSCIELSCGCIRGFNPKRMTPDAHLESFFESNPGDEELQVFVQEVFDGYLLRRAILKRLVNSFYTHVTTALREDKLMYAVLFYLLMFRANDLGSAIGAIIKALDSLKMHVFLVYFFDNIQLVEAELLREFDINHVRDVMIPSLIELGDSLAGLRKSLRAGVLTPDEARARSAKIASTMTTKPEPFRLTQPKPPLRPELMEEIESTCSFLASAAPIDPTRDSQVIAARLAEARRDNFVKSSRLLSESQAPKLRIADRMQRRKERGPIEEAVSPVSVKARPMPEFQPVDVRLNTAALLREHHLYRKEAEEEALRLRAMEASSLDDSEFQRWRHEQQQKDDIEKARRVAETKVMLRRALQSAIDARESMEEEKRLVAAKERQNAEALLAKAKDSRQVAVLQKRSANKRATRALKAKRDQALCELRREKRERRDAIRSEEEELFVKMKHEKDVELRHKRDLIMQLRALFEVRRPSVKVFDPSETANHGLLVEMSVAELEARLAAEKEAEAQRVVLRRSEIAAAKADHESSLQTKAQQVLQRRQRMKQTRSALRTAKLKKRKEEAEEAKLIHEQATVRAFAKIKKNKEKRKEERMDLARKVRDVKRAQVVRSMDREQIVQSYYDDLQQADVRRAGALHHGAEGRKEVQQRAKVRADKLRRTNRETQRREKEASIADVDKRLDSARERFAELQKEQQELQMSKTAKIRRTKQLVLKRRDAEQPYAARISSLSRSGVLSATGTHTSS